MVGFVSGHVAADRLAHAAVRAVGTEHVLGPHDALRSFVLARRVREGHHDWILVALVHLEPPELESIVGLHARGRVGHHLGEVVEDARLVDDQVRVLADAGGVVDGARRADDPGRVAGVRLPERHLGDAVRLGDDPLGEPERIERLDTSRLDAVGLPDRETPSTALDDAGGDAGELGELCSGDHACGTRAHDEHVDLVGQFVGPAYSDTGRRQNARVSGHIAVVVELHGLSSHHREQCSIIEHRVRISLGQC